MAQISGYGTMSEPLPRPTYNEATASQPPKRQEISTMPYITEEQSREALLQLVSEHCCYGKNAAQELVFTDITHTSAFHYTLETFTENRSINRTYEPFRGQPIDRPPNGPAPGLWNIPAAPPFLFKNNVMKIEVPHTASIKPCHDCHGIGRRRCHICLGRGRLQCKFCGGHHAGHVVCRVVCRVLLGALIGALFGVHCGHHVLHAGRHGGHSGHHGGHHRGHHGGHHGGGLHHAPCHHCSGLGHKRCYNCHGNGKIRCKTCEGMASLKCFIQLTVTWTNHVDDHVVERTALPEGLIKQVTGEIALKEEQTRVRPLNQFPDNINQASQQLVSRSLSRHQMAKILKMRQQVRVIPIAEANYQWKGKMSHFHVYGFEHKVYAPDYPQQCCCGCTIL